MLILTDRFSELLSLLDVLSRSFNALCSSTERAGCDVESSTVQAGKAYFETLPTLSYQILFGHLDIIEIDDPSGLAVPSQLVLVRSK